jgi:hypothetical protein
MRIALMKRYLAYFPAKTVRLLLADREFVGADWMEFLCENNIPFAIRIRDNLRITTQEGHDLTLRVRLRQARRSRVFRARLGSRDDTASGNAPLLTIAAKPLKDAVGALWAEHRLSTVTTGARPLAQIQAMAVERIGTTYHPVGTHAQIEAGRGDVAALEEAAQAELRELVDAGFDAMLAGVDPFLDDYYSLRGEYWRIGVTVRGWVRGDAGAAIEAHLASLLSEALDGDRHLRPVADRLADLVTVLAEEQVAQQAREESLFGSPIAEINPARLRVEATFPAFVPLPELRSPGLFSTVEARLGGSGAVGVLGAVVARRVLQVLVQRGILRMGARAVLAAVPLVGTLVMIGTDAAALALEEHFNRADFRAEIVGAIGVQSASVLNTLAAPAED